MTEKYLKEPENKDEAAAYFEYTFRQDISADEVTQIYKNWAGNYHQVSTYQSTCLG
jgi:hypothetical protein